MDSNVLVKMIVLFLKLLDELQRGGLHPLPTFILGWMGNGLGFQDFMQIPIIWNYT